MSEEPSTQQAREHFRVQMESFEGPLDLLLALIQKDEMEIFSVSLSQITEEYLKYVNLVQQLDLDMAGDYLVVAATLVLMKSRALLPREEEEEEIDQDDPHLLYQRIEEYKRFQSVADRLREHEQYARRLHFRKTEASRELGDTIEFYDLNVYDLYSVFRQILSEIGEEEPTVIRDENWTVDEKMVELQERLQNEGRTNLMDYLRTMHTKLEIIVTFLALLELIRTHQLAARQGGTHGDIWIVRPETKQE